MGMVCDFAWCATLHGVRLCVVSASPMPPPPNAGRLVHAEVARPRRATRASAAAGKAQLGARRHLGMAACFLVSGLMHEVQFIYMVCRAAMMQAPGSGTCIALGTLTRSLPLHRAGWPHQLRVDDGLFCGADAADGSGAPAGNAAQVRWWSSCLARCPSACSTAPPCLRPKLHPPTVNPSPRCPCSAGGWAGSRPRCCRLWPRWPRCKCWRTTRSGAAPSDGASPRAPLIR